MTNGDLIAEFISGKRPYNAYCHLGYKGNSLWNYSTVLCVIDRENKTARFNCRKYSSTTNRIQSDLRRQLKYDGYTITDYVGDRASMWNAGYTGAETWKVSDFKD